MIAHKFIVGVAKHHKISSKVYSLSGLTNGDDSLYWNTKLLAVADGVGQWNKKPKGNPGLYSRVLLHNLAKQAEQNVDDTAISLIERAYFITKRDALLQDFQGSTTLVAAFLENSSLTVVNIGDSRCYVIRDQQLIFTTKDQWHWFDCPFQLGDESLDTPMQHAVIDRITVQENDIVVITSDGVSDNLFDSELLEACNSVTSPQAIAEKLLNESRHTAYDPTAETPYMEKWLLEFGAIREGGKIDDISILVGKVKFDN